MDKEWEKENVKKHEELARKYEQGILSYVQSCDFFKDDSKAVEEIIQLAENIRLGNLHEGTGLFEDCFCMHKLFVTAIMMKKHLLPHDFTMNDSLIFEVIKGTTGIKIFDEVKELSNLPVYEFIKEAKVASINRNFVDSEPVEFKGDIVIMDPILLDTEPNHDSWYKNQNGMHLEKMGINHFMTSSTMLAGCTFDVFCNSRMASDVLFDNENLNISESDIIGRCKTNSFFVSVLCLSDVERCNPNFMAHVKENPSDACIIKDFCGTVQFIIKEDKYGNFVLFIVGDGINLKTGNPINFSTHTI